MFVDYAVDISMPEATAAELLIAHGLEMEGMGAAAYRRGEELRSRVGPGRLLAKEVIVALGPPMMSRHATIVPVRWRATGAEALFPSLDGELSIAGDDSHTRIELKASYRPPLGSIGSLMDRLVLAGLARSTITDWIDRIVDWLQVQTASAEWKHDLYHGAGSND